MSIFEQYPRPWKLVEINVSDYMIQDANGYRVLPTPQIFTFAHGGTAFWEEVIECVNAISLPQPIDE